jgi:transcriptional regulator NrdR family protein
MVCIYCGGNLAVTNSRPQKSRNQVWRRRQCTACKALFTAVEALDLSQAIIVDASPLQGSSGGRPKTLGAGAGALHPFDRDKLFISLYNSLRHRTDASIAARGLTDTVIARILKSAGANNGRIHRQTIRQTALQTLERFDAAAATHYLAFHSATSSQV